MKTPLDQIPGQETYLYMRLRDVKCCLHSCTVWECPESVCLEDFPGTNARRGGRATMKRYQETLEAYKVYQECKDINEAAKILGVDPSNARKRFKWFQSITGEMSCL